MNELWMDEETNERMKERTHEWINVLFFKHTQNEKYNSKKKTENMYINATS